MNDLQQKIEAVTSPRWSTATLSSMLAFRDRLAFVLRITWKLAHVLQHERRAGLGWEQERFQGKFRELLTPGEQQSQPA